MDRALSGINGLIGLSVASQNFGGAASGVGGDLRVCHVCDAELRKLANCRFRTLKPKPFLVGTSSAQDVGA